MYDDDRGKSFEELIKEEEQKDRLKKEKEKAIQEQEAQKPLPFPKPGAQVQKPKPQEKVIPTQPVSIPKAVPFHPDKKLLYGLAAVIVIIIVVAGIVLSGVSIQLPQGQDTGIGSEETIVAISDIVVAFGVSGDNINSNLERLVLASNILVFDNGELKIIKNTALDFNSTGEQANAIGKLLRQNNVEVVVSDFFIPRTIRELESRNIEPRVGQGTPANYIKDNFIVLPEEIAGNIPSSDERVIVTTILGDEFSGKTIIVASQGESIHSTISNSIIFTAYYLTFVDGQLIDVRQNPADGSSSSERIQLVINLLNDADAVISVDDRKEVSNPLREQGVDFWKAAGDLNKLVLPDSN